MRKLLVLVIAFMATVPAFSQDIPTKTKKKFDLTNRAGDHFMIQLGFNSLQGAPDSVESNIKGLQRSANIYLMFDKPFKGNPRFSVAIGAGIGTNNYYFKKMIVDIGATGTALLPFRDVDSAQNYKKFKLSTAFLEVPLELRFSLNPEMPNKTFKAAIGVKAGTLLNAHTKGKILRDANDRTLNDNTVKVSSKNFFNTTRLAGTARVGYGNFTLFGAYSFTGVFKDGVAADMKTLQIGLTISGL
ncbi:MAG: outer membrane beta-barrel protein [Rhizobacter sp.]|nr:outer membrane beta-barrel protein [Ferruginibacter sp.]